MKRIFLLLIAAIGLVSSCTEKHTDNLFAVEEDITFITFMEMEENAAVYSQWYELIDHAGLKYTFNINESYTYFIPNNDAVTAYLRANNYSSVTAIPKADAEILVKYHTINSEKTGKTLYSSDNLPEGTLADTTATGDLLFIEWRGGLDDVYLNGEARFAAFDLEVTSGVIHQIEKVLTPTTQSIFDMIKGNGSYSIMVEALELTGYDEEMARISEYFTNSSNIVTERKYYYTLFVVSDDTYRAAGISSARSLAEYLGESSSDYTADDNELKRYVGYHILDRSYSYAELADYGSDTTKSKNIETLTPYQLINFKDVNGSLVINYNYDTETGIEFTSVNNFAKNGNYHEVNDVMPISLVPASAINWEFTDYSNVLKSLVSNFQSTSTSTVNSRTSLKLSDVSSIMNWETRPLTDEKMESSVRYRLYTASPYSSCLHRDVLELVLGTTGWFEMQTPTIMAGRYKLTLYHITTAATSAGIQGQVDLYFDDEIFASSVGLLGVANDESYYATDLGEYYFPENRDYTFKLVQKTNNTIMLDYLKFEPINN